MDIIELGESEVKKQVESSKIEEKIKNDIKISVLNYLNGNVENLPEYIKTEIEKLNYNLIEGCNTVVNLSDIKIEQFVISPLGNKHKQVNFVVKIGDTIKAVSSIVNTENNEIQNLTISDSKSESITGNKDNLNVRNNTSIFVRSKDPRFEEKEGIEVEEELEERLDNIFNEIVFKKWNGIFNKNKEELENNENNKEKGDIIQNNAKAIANLFDGILQGTVDYTFSASKDIEDYFIHFLEKSPILKEKPKITEIKEIEDSIIVANGTYTFELDGEDKRADLKANFTFIFKRLKNNNWTISLLHSYTN